MSGSLKTLRGRLLAGTALATALILAGAGVLVYFFVRISLVGEFDAALESATRALAALTEQDESKVSLEPDAFNLAEFTRRNAPDYFAVWNADGSAVGESKSLAGAALPHAAPALNQTILESLRLPDGAPGRQASLTFVPIYEDAAGKTGPGTRIVTLTVARHTAPLDARLAGLAWLLAGVGIAATGAAAGVMLWVVRRGLRPLEQLAARISAAGRKNLGERVEISDAPGELTTVVARLNELLDRVEMTVIRERRFTADVAHELRTPLAGLEATIDVCATRRRMPEEYERTLARCGRIVRGMHAMVENLMALARADARQLTISVLSVELPALLEDCWGAFESAAKERELAAVFQVDSETRIDTDADKLRIVLNNLLDNAVTHADPGGWIRIIGRRSDRGIGLHFSNPARKLTLEQVQRCFDRFWRGDAARTGNGAHCGLGLSLCREMIELLGGTIAATLEDGVFCVSIDLPNQACGSSGGQRRSLAENAAVGAEC